jgi:hypothetical protein
MSGDNKVLPHHLQKKAILYVRQSSAFQAAHNRESRALQYAMRDQLAARGWHDIEVIDEDVGRSAAGHVERTVFERMVAEVPGSGRRRRGPRGVAVRPQQPRVAATRRGVPGDPMLKNWTR